ncbi:MAG: extracellular solute-binding protein [Lachnospiraceae bacterium]
MKKRFTSFLALAMALCLGFTACGSKDSNNGNEDLAGTYDITVWVSELDGVKELTQQQIEAFCKANPGIVINATVEGVSEAESATQMINSVEDGADLFCFSQDQLARLVMAGALNKLGSATAAKVTEMNDAGAVAAASVGGDLYCYPLTSDNGFYMYYDKSVIKEEHLDSLEDLIADCEAAGRLFSMELETSAWYNASFFFATGCVSEWETDSDGNFISINDTFNSENGVIALKGMQKLLKSKAYNSSSNGADFAAAVPSAVVISGTWALKAVKDALGDNFGATDLPSFTVDGKTYHMGSFSGNKLMGVKPQTDAKKGAVLQQLALYLTGEECQLQRFDLVGWGPSNLKAQTSDKVKSDTALSALAAQSAYAKPQCNIHGSWWDIGKLYATSAKTATTDDELRAALQEYENSVKALFNMSADEKEAFSVIGSINGDGWSVDLPMEKQGDGVWITTEAYALKEGDEFKVRQGKSWDVNYGVDGLNGANFVVEKDGTYKIKFTLSGEQGTIELVAQ